MTKRKFVPLTVLVVLMLAVIGGCPQETSPKLGIVNNTTKVMSALNMRSQDGQDKDGTWGDNLLSSALAAGGTCDVSVSVGVYDLRAQFTSDSTDGATKTVSLYRYNVPFVDTDYWNWFFADSSGIIVDSLATVEKEAEKGN